MPEDKRPAEPGQEEGRGWSPASPVKRTLAWTGLVYMLILLVMTTYPYFTGTGLGNLGPCWPFPGSSAWGRRRWCPGKPQENRGEDPQSPWPPCAGCWPLPPCPSASPGCCLTSGGRPWSTLQISSARALRNTA